MPIARFRSATRHVFTASFIALVVAILTCRSASAQASPPQSLPAIDAKHMVFEVASIRPNPKEQYFGVVFTPDGAHAVGISLENLIRSAYNQRHDGLWSGGPSWIASEHYDLTAKFDPTQFKDVTSEQGRAMLQALLADRFRLVVRRDTKILPHYALVVAKGGPLMQETMAENIKFDGENKVYCRPGLSVFKQCSMAEFANMVSWFGAGPSVEDRTGLIARYDFTLNWAPQSAASNPDASPDIFSAVQEQLGLKLEPIKGPVDTYVIDHVERPTEN
jgi:uncharacterized protein (TIGR03435 family)